MDERPLPVTMSSLVIQVPSPMRVTQSFPLKAIAQLSIGETPDVTDLVTKVETSGALAYSAETKRLTVLAAVDEAPITLRVEREGQTLAGTTSLKTPGAPEKGLDQGPQAQRIVPDSRGRTRGRRSQDDAAGPRVPHG